MLSLSLSIHKPAINQLSSTPVPRKARVRYKSLSDKKALDVKVNHKVFSCHYSDGNHYESLKVHMRGFAGIASVLLVIRDDKTSIFDNTISCPNSPI
jgi:hypothetical protein